MAPWSIIWKYVLCNVETNVTKEESVLMAIVFLYFNKQFMCKDLEIAIIHLHLPDTRQIHFITAVIVCESILFSIILETETNYTEYQITVSILDISLHHPLRTKQNSLI